MSEGPEALADALILVPTRRAARALHDAFLQTAGPEGALLLPQIRTLGDLDEGEPPFEPGTLALDLPAAIAPMRRSFELASLALMHQHLIQQRLDASAALEMAQALGALFESAAIEEVTPNLNDLSDLVAGDFAGHWRTSAAFLEAVNRDWRSRLEALGVVDAAERQVRLLGLLAEQFERDPPAGLVVAAGVASAAPATARLLKGVGNLPNGAVVLPGLSTPDTMPVEVWTQIKAEEPQHPQSGLKRLLEAVGIAREEVQPWPADETADAARRGRQRRRVLDEALRPVEATADWLSAIAELRNDPESADPLADGLAGLAVVQARHEDEAALVAALLLRETLETPGQTAAVITPDPALGRRVQAALGRFDIVADASAGEPVALQAVAELARLLLLLAADGRPDGVALLALLKNPLVRLGRDPLALRDEARELEKRAIRGPAVRDWPRLERRLEEARERARKSLERGYIDQAEANRRIAVVDAASGLLGDVAALASDLRQALAGDTPAPDAARALVTAMERAARDGAVSTGGLWAGPAGEAAARLFEQLITDGDALPPVTRAGFAELVDGLMAGEIIRAAEATHGRIRILGLIEARLVRADRLILLGLDEGVWPAPAPTDPFLSRPMREQLGLPSPERRIGQAAHDFAQAAAAPEVTLIHSERRGGAPAVKSRWLWRLETLAKGAGATLPGRPDLLAWARALDRPVGPPAYAKRPEPKPPVEVRPKELSVTRVEGWIRDPYATYARYVLGLSAMDRPSEAVEAAARGVAIHAALEDFAKAWEDELPPDCEGALLDAIAGALIDKGMDEATLVRERLLAGHCARWLADFEARRRAGGVQVKVERKGVRQVMVDGEPFTITARADRLEVDGGLVHVWDYKTGYAPTRKEIDCGLSPQLSLTAAIIAAGGFDGLPNTPGDLGYVRLTGRNPPGEEIVRVEAGESLDLADQVIEELSRRVRAFRREETPYRSWAVRKLLSKYSGDYDRLARVWEWFVVGADDEEASS